MTSEWGLGNGFSLWVSERPLRDVGPDREGLADGLRSIELYPAGRKDAGSEADVVRPPD